MTTAENILDSRRRLAEAVNDDIKLPVRWHVVRRVGRPKGVCHIQLDSSLIYGNLHRRSGALLCGAGADGTEVAEACDSAGRPYSQEVTCKKCLAHAAVFLHAVYPPKHDFS